MNAHTHTDALRLTAALPLTSKRAPDNFCTCASCRINTFERDEMAVKSNFIEGHVANLEAYFSGNVCDTCANYIELPNADDDCDHERLERHGWEQI